MAIRRHIKRSFPDDHPNHPGTTFESVTKGDQNDDGTFDETTLETKERSYKRSDHPDGPPPFAENPDNPGETKPPEVSGNS